MLRTSLFTLLLFVLPVVAHAGELYVGGSHISITPDEPVAISGQLRTRISEGVETPCTATVLAIETRQGTRPLEQAIFVSCDLVAIREGVLEGVRAAIGDRLPGVDLKKIILNATHTHTGPVMIAGRYDIPEDVMQPARYVEFLTTRVADAIVAAWEARAPASVGWGLGHAVVAQNRRSVYLDGSAKMYGPTDRDDFLGFESGEDHGVEVLAFWDADKNLIATAINVACPAQEVEAGNKINADFWHPVRESLKKEFGENLFVLGWTGAAGDQSPHLMYRKAAEERMRKARGLSRLDELAGRIVTAWHEAYEGARLDPRSDVPFVHRVETLELPRREVTQDEYRQVQETLERMADKPQFVVRARWHRQVVERYERQTAGDVTPYKMELHAIRLGDIAIATNDFELFTDYGIQIKAKSPAVQTFVIQLAGPGTYIPTPQAAAGGGYSAIVESNEVGPEGGQILVDRTFEILYDLWP